MKPAMKTFILLFLSLSAFATTPSTSKKQFCLDRENPDFVKDLARHEDNLMSFRNQGGIGGGGVCWWHSRFQRTALHMTYYTPDSPKPTRQEALQIIRDIRNYNGVIEIKGFKNFYEFSVAYRNEIQDELERMQMYEGRRLTWLRGLRGSSVVHPDLMKSKMDELYEEVEVRNRIAYQKLQMKGITAHAWLVISMKKDDAGYDLEVLDSNYPNRTSFYRYNIGDTNLDYVYVGPFVPYLERQEEVESMSKDIADFCASELAQD